MTDSLTGQARIDYWQSQIDAWQASGLSQQAFCREHSLNYPQFVYWRRKFRLAATGEPAANTTFVPVMTATCVPEGGLSLSLPNGVQLHGIDRSNLEVVLQLLGRLP
jgi:hypothetical protein